MPSSPSSKRTYQSTVRRDQAERTRLRISEAAAPMFAERGYAGTSIRAIADIAGVAIETIYSIGGKNEVFLNAFTLALRGTTDGTPLLDIPSVSPARKARSLDRFLSVVIDFVMTANEKTVGLWLTFVEGARSDPDLARSYREQMALMREQGSAVLAFAVERRLCKPPRDPQATIDAIWATLHPSQYDLLVSQAGWDHNRYRAWLLTTVKHVLRTSA